MNYLKTWVLALLLALFAAPALACKPSQIGGDGTTAIVAVNTYGLGALWWCHGNPPRPRIVAIEWASVTPELAGHIYKVVSRAPDAQASWDALAALATKDIMEMQDIWMPSTSAHQASKPAAQMEVWEVQRAPSNANPAGTRPTFLLNPATGVLTSSGNRIQEFSPCDCNQISHTTGTTRYCAVRNQEVAVCVRR